jgi:alkylation response protein AidB-like acyl-CoA dehydrogenase
MDFRLDPAQLAVRDSVRTFARAELAPGYLTRAKSTVFPWDVHRRIADLGVYGLLAGPDQTRWSARTSSPPGWRWRSSPTPTSTWRTWPSRCC